MKKEIEAKMETLLNFVLRHYIREVGYAKVLSYMPRWMVTDALIRAQRELGTSFETAADVFVATAENKLREEFEKAISDANRDRGGSQ